MDESDDELTRAHDPRTPADELRRLGTRGQRPELRAAVAANPGSPIDLVLALAREHPDNYAADCLRNPIWPLALLENPALLLGVTWRTLDMLLAASPTDEALLRALAEAFEAGPRDAAPHPPVKGFHLDTRLCSAARLFLRNPATPPDVLERIRADLLDRDAELAVHPRVSPRMLRGLLASEDPEVRRLAARHPSAPADFVALLRRCGLGDDLNAPSSPTGALSEHEFFDLADAGLFTWKLAIRHPGVSPETIERLARYESFAVCGAIVARGTPPASVLQRAIDETEIFFRFLRPRPNSPPGFWKTPLDPRVFLRMGLALCPSSPPRVLRLLERDPEPLVWLGLLDPPLPSTAQCSLLRAHPFVLTGPMLASPATAASALALVAQQHSAGVRRLTISEARLLVHHPNAPVEALGQLADHPDPLVRQAIARRLAALAAAAQPPAPAAAAAPPPPAPPAASAEATPRATGSWLARWLGRWRR